VVNQHTVADTPVAVAVAAVTHVAVTAVTRRRFAVGVGDVGTASPAAAPGVR
jgi:hypothetical protein